MRREYFRFRSRRALCSATLAASERLRKVALKAFEVGFGVRPFSPSKAALETGKRISRDITKGLEKDT